MAYTNFETREQWLEMAVAEIMQSEQLNISTPVNISCGFPAGTRCKDDFVVYAPEMSKANEYEIFISPTIDEPNAVLTATSRALHRIAFTDGGDHGCHFDPTLADELGAYPHSAIKRKPTGKTYMVKCQCPGCGYPVRTTRRWIKKHGAPLCPNTTCGDWGQSMKAD